jgi:hypothetical protein
LPQAWQDTPPGLCFFVSREGAKGCFSFYPQISQISADFWRPVLPQARQDTPPGCVFSFIRRFRRLAQIFGVLSCRRRGKTRRRGVFFLLSADFAD